MKKSPFLDRFWANCGQFESFPVPVINPAPSRPQMENCLPAIHPQLRLMSLPFGYLVIFRWSFSEQKPIYSEPWMPILIAQRPADGAIILGEWHRGGSGHFLFKCELCKDIFESEETMRCHIMKRRNDLFWPVMEPLFSESGTGGSDQSSHQGLSLWLAYKPTKY